MTKDSLGGDQPWLGTGLTFCWHREPSSHSDKTGIEWPVTKGHLPHTPGACPTGHFEGHSHKLSPDPQNTCGLVGQTPMPLTVPSWGYRAGPVFHGQNENTIAPLESEAQLAALSQLKHPVVDLPSEAEECDYFSFSFSLWNFEQTNIQKCSLSHCYSPQQDGFFLTLFLKFTVFPHQIFQPFSICSNLNIT